MTTWTARSHHDNDAHHAATASAPPAVGGPLLRHPDGRPAPAPAERRITPTAALELAGHRRGHALPLRRQRGDLHVAAHPIEGGVDEHQRVDGADGAGSAQVRLLHGERRGGRPGGDGESLDRASRRGDRGGDLGDLTEVRPAGRQHLGRARRS